MTKTKKYAKPLRASHKSVMDAERETHEAFMAMPVSETAPVRLPSIEHEDFYAIRRREVLGHAIADYRMAVATASNSIGLLTATRQALADKNCEASHMRFSLINLLEACEEVMALDTSVTTAHGRLKRAMEDAMEIVA